MKPKYDETKYAYRVQWSEDDQVHIGSCLEFPSLNAHGKTPEQALNEICSVVAETLRWMAKDGEKIPEPLGIKNFKGNLTLRVSSDLHRQLALRSAEQGISINQYVLARIAGK